VAKKKVVPKKVSKKKSSKPESKRYDFLEQPVSSIAQPPHFIFANDAVTDAAKMMRDRITGCVFVAESSGTKDEPIGILTEWDLLSKLVAAGKEGATTRVREIMSSPVVKIEADERVSDALRLMLNRGIRRLAVMQDGVLVGTITQSLLVGRSVGRRSSAMLPVVEKIQGHVCPYCASNFLTRRKLESHIEAMHEETLSLETRDRLELNSSSV